MDSKVVDWKVSVALGGTLVLAIFVLKMDSDDAKEAFNHMVDAAKESLIAIYGNH
ncbi:MAG: hypothetical protein ABRQ24_02570 [Syntrophomonadaceae bacterium]